MGFWCQINLWVFGKLKYFQFFKKRKTTVVIIYFVKLFVKHANNFRRFVVDNRLCAKAKILKISKKKKKEISTGFRIPQHWNSVLSVVSWNGSFIQITHWLAACCVRLWTIFLLRHFFCVTVKRIVNRNTAKRLSFGTKHPTAGVGFRDHNAPRWRHRMHRNNAAVDAFERECHQATRRPGARIGHVEVVAAGGRFVFGAFGNEIAKTRGCAFKLAYASRGNVNNNQQNAVVPDCLSISAKLLVPVLVVMFRMQEFRKDFK